MSISYYYQLPYIFKLICSASGEHELFFPARLLLPLAYVIWFCVYNPLIAKAPIVLLKVPRFFVLFQVLQRIEYLIHIYFITHILFTLPFGHSSMQPTFIEQLLYTRDICWVLDTCEVRKMWSKIGSSFHFEKAKGVCVVNTRWSFVIYFDSNADGMQKVKSS